MTLVCKKTLKEEKGFTLVELAVVMIIIGLLVGGILKGQEMIANAQVTSTIAQVKAVDAATSTFYDIYDAFPGDMNNATTRIAGCAAPCGNGSGNDVLDSEALIAAPNAEALMMFRHLGGADLLGGSTTSMAAYPEGNIKNTQLVPGYTNDGTLGLGAAVKTGHYMGVVAQGNAGNGVALTPLEAARIDRKMDDGIADEGSVVANGNGCAAAGVYDEDNPATLCAVAARFQ